MTTKETRYIFYIDNGKRRQYFCEVDGKIVLLPFMFNAKKYTQFKYGRKEIEKRFKKLKKVNDYLGYVKIETTQEFRRVL